MTFSLPASDVAAALMRACELDVQAFKPGNVSVDASGHDMHATDFLASAEAACTPLCTPGLRVGERIHAAVKATRAAVGCNTNLGIVLLAAPLVHAVLTPKDESDLRRRLEQVLIALDVGDAVQAYAAIRLASPGGLGSSTRHDVVRRPEVTLREAMAEARDRDRIALAYATGYADVFLLGLPVARDALSRWGSEPWSAVAVYLAFLARFPDTHVQRKFGRDVARDVGRQAAQLQRMFSQAAHPRDCLPQLRDFDVRLKSAGINPGTSADFTVCTFLTLRLQERLQQLAMDRSASAADGPDPKRASVRRSARIFQHTN
jgi:triphosphoribosyl-dephospho-CoA synthase